MDRGTAVLNYAQIKEVAAGEACARAVVVIVTRKK